MSRGYLGKVLFVDLATGKMEDVALDDEICRQFLGGYGIAAKLLYDRMKPGVDPLGPGNILGFMTGPLTGTPAIIGSRYVVVGKSPLTGGWGDANSGGYFGPALKNAGYDGVFFTGSAPRPTYLLVDNGQASLHEASALWGKDASETDDWLKAQHGKDVRIACIGPSGESLSLISCVMNDAGRAAGRSGLGAVMGSKKLKAIVAKGSIEVPLADGEAARALRSKYLKETDGGFGPILKKYGTAGITAGSAFSGDSPIKNWDGVGLRDVPNAHQVSDDAVIAFETKKFACWRCPLACGGIVEVPSGPYAVREGHKPEYETLCMLGTNVLNDNVESIIKLSDICNRSGLDTISVGAVVAFAIGCFENGILTTHDTGGLELTWGNHQAIVALTEKIARREGIGNVLADGVKVAAERIGKGSEKYAVHSGGQELPAHDPRFTPGLGPTYLLDATPGRHTQGGEMVAPPSGLKIGAHDRTTYTGRAQDQRTLVNLMHVINAAGLCMFGYITLDAQSLPDFLTAVTGWKYTLEDCIELGERIGTARHLFNLREGINPLHRDFSARALGKPPATEGPLANITVDLDTMVKEYLQAMDWDLQTTMPSERRLQEMGLADMAADIPR